MTQLLKNITHVLNFQVYIPTSERPVVAGHPPQRQRQSVEPGCGQRPQHHTRYTGGGVRLNARGSVLEQNAHRICFGNH